MRFSSGLNNIAKLFTLSLAGNKRLYLLVIFSGITVVAFEITTIYALSLFFDAEMRINLIKQITLDKKYQFFLPALIVIRNINDLIIPFFVASVLARLYALRIQYISGARIITQISNKIFEAMVAKPYEWHMQNDSSATISILTKDVDNVFETIKNVINLTCNLPIIVGLTCYILFSNSSTFFILTFLISSYVILFAVSKGRIMKYGFILSESHQRSVSLIQSAFLGIKTIKLDNLEKNIQNRFFKTAKSERKAAAELSYIGASTRVIAETLIILSVLIWIIFETTLNGKPLDSLVLTFAPIAFALLRTIYPLQTVFNAVSSLKSTKRSTYKALSILNTPNTLKVQDFQQFKINKRLIEPNTHHLLESVTEISVPAIDCRDVCYRYPNSSEEVLRNINISFYSGISYGLIGKSGDGKSTLMGLITGLLTPTSGQIYHDNLNINRLTEIQKFELNKKVSYIPQSIFMFNNTILANITLFFGKETDLIDINKVWYVLKLVEMHDVVHKLDQGIYTNVGENSVNFSGGQSQRLGIARALYKNPNILLMDEATSALDKKTEDKLCHNIKEAYSTKTLVIISHRSTPLEYCDKLVRIKDLNKPN